MWNFVQVTAVEVIFLSVMNFLNSNDNNSHLVLAVTMCSQ